MHLIFTLHKIHKQNLKTKQQDTEIQYIKKKEKMTIKNNSLKIEKEK